MAYQVIFEIGPIWDAVRATRKLRDQWGASFLFSFLMGQVAKSVLENEHGKVPNPKVESDQKLISQTLIVPQLQGDELLDYILTDEKTALTAGSIPDQLICRCNKEDTPAKVKSKFNEQLDDLFRKCVAALEVASTHEILIAPQQLRQYFRLFYSIFDEKASLETMKAASAARGDIHEFITWADEVNTVPHKDDKCSLCGDRKMVLELKQKKRNGKPEKLCAVCSIKRGLISALAIPNHNAKFPATTDIAAKLVAEFMQSRFALIKSELIEFSDAQLNPAKIEYKEASQDLEEHEMNRQREYRTAGDVRMVRYFSYQLYFSDLPASKQIRYALKDQWQKKMSSEEKLTFKTSIRLDNYDIDIMTWLQHGYYALLATDGDDMGQIILNADNKDEISKNLLMYSKHVAAVIAKYGGKLIFSGGEDTIAIVHPLYLLKVINELEAAYRDKINATLNGKPASISVGAVICPHKHPLSLAVDTADYMLNEVAKKEPGKASVAISLVKGHSETSQLICKIQDETLFSIHDLEALFSARLPRGFVYKLSEEEMVLAKTLLTKDDVLKYVGSVYERSHDRQATLPEALERAINKMEWPAEVPKTLNRLLEHLYFVRFLEGEAS